MLNGNWKVKVAILFLGILIACPMVCLSSPQNSSSNCAHGEGKPEKNTHLTKACCNYNATLPQTIPEGIGSSQLITLTNLGSDLINTPHSQSFQSGILSQDLLLQTAVLRI